MINYFPTEIEDLYILKSKKIDDDRGFFLRAFCDVIHMKITGKSFNPVQVNQSFTVAKGTVRGMHFQNRPALEGKIVRCVKGKILDVAVDLRMGSKTFLKHVSVELNADEGNALYIPEGFAHGFQSLENDCQVIYLHSSPYSSKHESGLLCNDPKLSIDWPIDVINLSDRDKSFLPISDVFKGIQI